MKLAIDMKLAIVGSRTLTNKQLVFTNIQKFIDKKLEYLFYNVGTVPDYIEIVSGGAKGVDALAKLFYQEKSTKYPYFWKYTEFPAIWRKDGVYDNSAAFKRNALIAHYADECLAFIDKPIEESKGTYNTVNHFINLNKPVTVITL